MDEVVYVALGSNLGDRAGNLAGGLRDIAETPGVELLAVTDAEETAPIGPAGQGAYLNRMAAIRTGLAPEALLDRLQEIEAAHGRVRGERWGARTLDLDIVRFGDRRIDTPRLSVPHAAIPQRGFWQREIAWLDAFLAGGAP